MRGQVYDHVIPWERALGTNFVGGWTGSRSSLDDVKKKSLVLAGNWIPGPPADHSVNQMSYPGSLELSITTENKWCNCARFIMFYIHDGIRSNTSLGIQASKNNRSHSTELRTLQRLLKVVYTVLSYLTTVSFSCKGYTAPNEVGRLLWVVDMWEVGRTKYKKSLKHSGRDSKHWCSEYKSKALPIHESIDFIVYISE